VLTTPTSIQVPPGATIQVAGSFNAADENRIEVLRDGSVVAQFDNRGKGAGTWSEKNGTSSDWTIAVRHAFSQKVCIGFCMFGCWSTGWRIATDAHQRVLAQSATHLDLGFDDWDASCCSGSCGGDNDFDDGKALMRVTF
jgi:hypothetical protein